MSESLIFYPDEAHATYFGFERVVGQARRPLRQLRAPGFGDLRGRDGDDHLDRRARLGHRRAGGHAR